MSPSSALNSLWNSVKESQLDWGRQVSRRLISLHTYLTAVDLGGDIGYVMEEESSVGKCCLQWVSVWKWPFASFTGPYFCLTSNASGRSAISLQEALFPRSSKKSPCVWCIAANLLLPVLKSLTPVVSSVGLSGQRARHSKRQNRSFRFFSTLLWDAARKAELHTAGWPICSSQKWPRDWHTWDMLAGDGLQHSLGLQGWLQHITGVKFILKTFWDFAQLCVSYSFLDPL